jgi:methionine--tRNA ligase beta chain
LDGIVPALNLKQEDFKILAKINQELKEYEENLDKLRLRDGIKNILNISRIGNQYMQAKKPWVLIKGSDEEKIRGATIISLCCNMSYLLSVLIYPYMPNVSSTIRKQLNVPTFIVQNESSNAQDYDSDKIKPGFYQYPIFYDTFNNFLKQGHKIGKPEPLFKRIAEADVKILKEKFGGVQQESKPDEKKVTKPAKKTDQPSKVVNKTVKIEKPKVVESSSPLDNLQAKSVQANQMINMLKNQIQQIKLETTPEFMTNKAKNLQKENEKLKKKIESLINELNAVEASSSTFKTKTVVISKPKDETVLTNNKIKQPKVATAAVSKVEQQNVSVEDINVSKLDIRIGKIVKCEKHPEAESLYVEQIDLGEGGKLRNVCSGLVKFIPLDEMQNRLVVCVCNLKPAKLRGILSEAMVLCASTPDKVELMQPPSNSQPGDRVVCEQFLGESAAECNTKNKIWDLVHVDLKTNDDLIGTYRGDSLVVKGKGPIMSQTLKNVPVK